MVHGVVALTPAVTRAIPPTQKLRTLVRRAYFNVIVLEAFVSLRWQDILDELVAVLESNDHLAIAYR